MTAVVDRSAIALPGRPVVADRLPPTLSVLRRWLAPLVVALLLGAGAGVLWAAGIQREYQTTVVVLVGPVVADRDLLEGTAELARTYGEIVESERVIEDASSSFDVDPDTVTVSATAGRKSTTLAITVRTPSKAATPLIALRLVEVMGDLVADNKATLRIPDRFVVVPPPAGAPPPTESFPLGSSLSVIDDGGGKAANTSLGQRDGAVFGGLASLLVMAALALSVEARRAEQPRARAVAQLFGRELGQLPEAPLVVRLLAGPRRRAAADDHSALLESRFVADEVTVLGTGGDGVLRLLVAAADDHPSYFRALTQLCLGFDPPPVVIDPTGAFLDWLDPGAGTRSTVTHAVSVGGEMVAVLISPVERRETTAEERNQRLRLIEQAKVILVFAPIDRQLRSWQSWASGTDHSVVLVRPAAIRDELDHGAFDRLRYVDAPVIGGVSIRRRWFNGSPRLVRSAAHRAVEQVPDVKGGGGVMSVRPGEAS